MNQKINNSSNPFKQTSKTWLVEFITLYQYVEQFAEYFEIIASSITYFELETGEYIESRPNDKWNVSLYFEEEPSTEDIQNHLNNISKLIQVETPSFTLKIIEDEDWVAAVQKNFPPINIGRFFVHGSHYDGKIPLSSFKLQIDAGRAFGTGSHETTSSCIKAIDILLKQNKFVRMLDMGCGSGILAIAMAKAWKRKIIAVDIDAQAIKTTKNNSVTNRVKQYIIASVSDGYKSRIVKENGKYDLIVANILAKPLVKFAPYLNKNLNDGGMVILSGLLSNQEKVVLSAHLQQKLFLVKRIKYNHWSTLILRKG
jgi:ribosomal protein L11 methyltransferase